MQLLITLDQETRADLALLDVLRGEHPSLSRSELRDFFKAGGVLFRGQPIKPSFLLRAGETRIELLSPERLLSPKPILPAPQGAFLPRVYEDENLLVLHKLSGVPSVPHSVSETSSAVNAALAACPELRGVGRGERGELEPGILHRLDTGTSGLLVFAKTDAEWQRLRGLWLQGGVQKIYRALARSSSDPISPLGPYPNRVETPLGHDAGAKGRMIALIESERERLLAKIRGEPLRAETVLLDAHEIQPRFLDLTIEIKTGVMHQIRCHLASLGWPIQGDPVYGGTPSRRLWLHAWRLRFPLSSGAMLELEAQLPEGWPASP